jgi:hypothetical protein
MQGAPARLAQREIAKLENSSSTSRILLCKFIEFIAKAQAFFAFDFGGTGIANRRQETNDL